MKSDRPTALTVVAWLFISIGALTVVDSGARAFGGTLNLNLGVLALPGGLGLLRARPGWRMFCLCALVVGVLGSAFLAAATVLAPEKIQFSWSATPRSELVLTAAVAWALIQIWAYRVLRREDVCAFFRHDSDPPKTA